MSYWLLWCCNCSLPHYMSHFLSFHVQLQMIHGRTRTTNWLTQTVKQSKMHTEFLMVTATTLLSTYCSAHLKSDSLYVTMLKCALRKTISKMFLWLQLIEEETKTLQTHTCHTWKSAVLKISYRTTEQKQETHQLPPLRIHYKYNYIIWYQGLQTPFRTCVQQMQCLEKMHTTQHDMKHNDSNYFKNNPALILLKFRLSCLLQNSVQARRINSTTFCILKLGTLHKNQHFSQVPGKISDCHRYFQIPGWLVYLLEYNKAYC